MEVTVQRRDRDGAIDCPTRIQNEFRGQRHVDCY